MGDSGVFPRVDTPRTVEVDRWVGGLVSRLVTVSCSCRVQLLACSCRVCTTPHTTTDTFITKSLTLSDFRHFVVCKILTIVENSFFVPNTREDFLQLIHAYDCAHLPLAHLLLPSSTSSWWSSQSCGSVRKRVLSTTNCVSLASVQLLDLPSELRSCALVA